MDQAERDWCFHLNYKHLRLSVYMKERFPHNWIYTLVQLLELTKLHVVCGSTTQQLHFISKEMWQHTCTQFSYNNCDFIYKIYDVLKFNHIKWQSVEFHNFRHKTNHKKRGQNEQMVRHSPTEISKSFFLFLLSGDLQNGSGTSTLVMACMFKTYQWIPSWSFAKMLPWTTSKKILNSKK